MLGCCRRGSCCIPSVVDGVLVGAVEIFNIAIVAVVVVVVVVKVAASVAGCVLVLWLLAGVLVVCLCSASAICSSSCLPWFFYQSYIAAHCHCSALRSSVVLCSAVFVCVCVCVCRSSLGAQSPQCTKSRSTLVTPVIHHRMPQPVSSQMTHSIYTYTCVYISICIYTHTYIYTQ